MSFCDLSLRRTQDGGRACGCVIHGPRMDGERGQQARKLSCLVRPNFNRRLTDLFSFGPKLIDFIGLRTPAQPVVHLCLKWSAAEWSREYSATRDTVALVAVIPPRICDLSRRQGVRVLQTRELETCQLRHAGRVRIRTQCSRPQVTHY